MTNLHFMFLSGSVLAQIPVSPFGDPNVICPKIDGVSVSVGGFPSSPFVITPFKDSFTNPPRAIHKDRVCRTDGHCLFSYDISVFATQKRPFDYHC